jgi:hypothetical protein
MHAYLLYSSMPPVAGWFGDAGAMPVSREGAAAVVGVPLAGRVGRGVLWGAFAASEAANASASEALFAASRAAFDVDAGSGFAAPAAEDAGNAPEAAIAADASSAADAAASGFGFTGAPGGGGNGV